MCRWAPARCHDHGITLLCCPLSPVLPVRALLKEASATKAPPPAPRALTHGVTSVKFNPVQARCSGKIPHPAPRGPRLLSQALTNWIHLTYRCLWKSSKDLFQETHLVSHWIYRVKVLPAGAVWTKAGLSTRNKSHIGSRSLPVSAFLSAYSAHYLSGRREWKPWRSKPHSLGREFIKRSTSNSSVFLPHSPCCALDGFSINFKPKANHN